MSNPSFRSAAELPDGDEDDAMVDEWVALFASRDKFARQYARMWDGWTSHQPRDLAPVVCATSRRAPERERESA